MHEFRVHTLVDITDNGSLHKTFPFKTPAGETIHEHDSEINKDQIITSAVFAGPITFAATVTVTGTVVVV